MKGQYALQPQTSNHTPTVCRVALVGVVLVLVVISYYPFGWDPPRTVRNEVTRNSQGFLQFGEMNNVRTIGTPAWLQDVRASGIVQIRLEFEPRSLQESASIMMLASNFWVTDFAIEQDHSDLLVWLRRPGSDTNGDPPFTVKGVLRTWQWNSAEVRLQRDDMRIVVNGRTRLNEQIPGDSSRVWSQGQIALGDEVHVGPSLAGHDPPCRDAYAGLCRQLRTSGCVLDP